MFTFLCNQKYSITNKNYHKSNLKNVSFFVLRRKFRWSYQWEHLIQGENFIQQIFARYFMGDINNLFCVELNISFGYPHLSYYRHPIKTPRRCSYYQCLSSAFSQMCLDRRISQLFFPIIVPPVRSFYCSQEAESSTEESFPPFSVMN